MERDWIQMNLRLAGTLTLFFLTAGNSMAQDPGGEAVRTNGSRPSPQSLYGRRPFRKSLGRSNPPPFDRGNSVGSGKESRDNPEQPKPADRPGRTNGGIESAIAELEWSDHRKFAANQPGGFWVSPLPGIPQIIGPFGVFDARGELSQTILNFRSLNNSKASVQNIKAAEFSFKDARDTVVLVVATLYMQAVRRRVVLKLRKRNWVPRRLSIAKQPI